MSRRDSKSLTPFSYVVLTLVGEGGAGPHDLVQMMRRGVLYWTAAESHYYSEPKRLAKLGYLDSRKVPGQTHERTLYTLTPEGHEALREWLAAPAGLPRIQNEAIVKLVAGSHAESDQVLWASLEPLRAELESARRILDENEEIAWTLPERERYLKLVTMLGRALVQAQSDWLDEVERELRPDGDGAA
ncbi:MAG: PadR family transcriptional regulator [Gaiellaceae bacterium]